jgi:HEAT repeat protein
LKEHALFVLSQSGSEKSREIIGRVAKGGSNPDLQKKALESLALFGGKESMPILGEVYASSADPDIKRAILGFYMIGGNKQSLLDAAKNEKSGDLRREAIGQLGVLGASQELIQLYDQEATADVKHKILDALFVSGNAGKLIELVRREKDPALRREAVEKLGLIGAEQTGKVLKDLYQNETDKKVKEAVLNAFFLQGNAAELVAVAKKETDSGLKRKAVEQLSIMGSKEGTDYFLELLNQ